MNPLVRSGLRTALRLISLKWPSQLIRPACPARLVAIAAVLMLAMGLIPAGGQSLPVRTGRGSRQSGPRASGANSDAHGLLGKFGGTLPAKTGQKERVEMEGDHLLS